MSGKTLGLIGFGKIEAVSRVAQPFGLKILVFSRTKYTDFESDILKFVDFDTLIQNSDIVSLHCPLTDQTKDIINKTSLSLMKSNAMLINTSRGPLINEKDLAEALKSKRIAYAALDVISSEPMRADNPLYQLENCIITPHIAWATTGARNRLMHCAFTNLKSYLKGIIVNKVN